MPYFSKDLIIKQTPMARLIAGRDKAHETINNLFDVAGLRSKFKFKEIKMKSKFSTPQGIVLGWDVFRKGKPIVMPDDMVFLHTLVVGATGSGKSRFVLDLVYNIYVTYKKLCIVFIDLKGEIAPSLSSLPDGTPSYMADSIINIKDYKKGEFNNIIGEDKVLTFDFSEKNRADSIKEFYQNARDLFSDMRDTVMMMSKRYKAENVPFRLLFVVEEAWKFFPNTGSGVKGALMGSDDKELPVIVREITALGQEFANAGRSLGFGMIFVTTRLQELMTTIISEANTIVAKNMNSDNDINKLKGTKVKDSMVWSYFNEISDFDRIKFAMLATSNANTIVELTPQQTYHYSVNPRLEKR